MRNKLLFLSYTLSLLLTGLSCSTPQVPLRVYTKINKEYAPEDPRAKQLMIAITSNIEKSSHQEHTGLGNISFAGRKLTEQYLNILKKEHSNKLLLIDLGNIQSPTFYKKHKYHAVTPTPKNLNEYIIGNNTVSLKLPLISGNTQIITTKKNKKLKGISPYKIVKINKRKVAIITLDQFPLDFATKYSNLTHVYLEDPIFSLLKIKTQLKKHKVHFTILILNNYDSKNTLHKLVSRIPRHSADLIIKNDNKSDPPYNEEISITKDKNILHLIKVENINKDSESHHRFSYDKIKICSHFWLTTNDCHIKEDEFKEDKISLIQKNNQTIPAQFLGSYIESLTDI